MVAQLHVFLRQVVNLLLVLLELSSKDVVVFYSLYSCNCLLISEKLSIRRFALVEGLTATYIHGAGSIGVIVKFDTDCGDKDGFADFAKNIALQAAALPSLYVDRASVPQSALDEETLRARIARETAEMEPTEFFSELLRRLVPKPLVMPLARELDIHSKQYISKLTEAEITRLIKTLKNLTFPISDYAPFEYAVTTAGGVRCSEVNPYTMESLKVKGLYLAGEVLDLDGDTGGYNLQIAFSTGRLAGQLKK